jgi:hypothetical protein
MQFKFMNSFQLFMSGDAINKIDFNLSLESKSFTVFGQGTRQTNTEQSYFQTFGHISINQKLRNVYLNHDHLY